MTRKYLAWMLKRTELAGAAFDVMTNEPPRLDDDLLLAPNFVISAHSAALTTECTVRVACEAAQGIVDISKAGTRDRYSTAKD